MTGTEIGHAWNQGILTGESPSVRALASKYCVNELQVRRHLSRAWLPAEIIEDILEGRIPADLTVHDLYRKLLHDWADQQRVLGFDDG